MNSIRAFLSSRRGSLLAIRSLRCYAVLLLAFSAVALGLSGWSFFTSAAGTVHPRPEILGLSALAAIPLAMWIAFATQPSILVIAHELDQHAGTKDRLLVGLALENLPWRHPMEEMAYREATDYLSDRSRFRAPGWRFPRELPWLLAPVTALALLHWTSALVEKQRATGFPDGPAGAVAAALRIMAEEIRQKTPEPEKPAVEDLANDVEQLARQLDASRAQPVADQQRDSLGALSGVEAALRRAAADAQPGLSDREREALEQALESVPSGADVSRAMRDGDRAAAARALDRFNAQADDAAMARVGERLSREMQERAQPGETGQPPAGQARRMIQQAAEQMRGSRSMSSRGSRQRQQSLKSMTAKVMAMKRDVREGREPREGEPDMFAFAEGGQQGNRETGAQAALAGASAPLAGTEDTGTTKDPFGERSAPPGNGATTSVSGLPGEGETLQAMIATAGGSAEAKRRYKDLYESALPDVRDAVLREDIPGGLRLTVRRYFELIRPKE